MSRLKEEPPGANEGSRGLKWIGSSVLRERDGDREITLTVAGGEAGSSDREPGVAGLRALRDLDQEVAGSRSPRGVGVFHGVEGIGWELEDAVAGGRTSHRRSG